MSHISKDQLSNNDSSQKEEPNTPNQNSPFLLKIKRERDDPSSLKCQECESGKNILSFSLSNKLMTYIYENVLNPNTDNQKKNELLALTLPNKTINLNICQNCLIKTLLTKGLNYLIPLDNNKIITNENDKGKNAEYDMLYKIYWNNLIKEIEKINSSIIDNSIFNEIRRLPEVNAYLAVFI